MAEPLRPTKLSTFGKKNWIYVPTIASATLAPTVAEITGATALDFTNMAFASAGKPSQNTNRVQAERRFGDTIVYEEIGVTTYTGGDMLYAFDAQGAALSNGVKAWEKFALGVTGFLCERIGIAKATTPIAGHFVNTYPVTLGPSMPTEAGDGETGESAATCSYAITGPPAFKIAILA